MKKVIMLAAVLTVGTMFKSFAQNPSQSTSTGSVSQQGKSPNTKTSSVEGMKRKGSGKMASGVTRSGNSNLSPTSPTNTPGTTSKGSGSDKGTRVNDMKEKIPAKSTKNGTATDGGLTSNGTPNYGTKVNVKSTSGSNGSSNRSTSTQARSSDANGSSNGAQPAGVGKADKMKRGKDGQLPAEATQNGNSRASVNQPIVTQGSTSQGSASVSSGGGAKGSQVKTASQKAMANTETKASVKSTSGSTGGSIRPTSTAATQQEARTSDANVSKNGPQPTGVGKAGTPSGNTAGRKAKGQSYPQQ
ncbi:hypothetical protein HNV11_20870 [Spirosoma taeanense]|uniref:Uncharacterized protein n=1 Tax=Spirosoma taeanense TaxID=2735870 RepID=A0A6M5YC15_9BACT|nr:hypothetical protein [Spirosoma taeanense]QJW91657.1 hypothetical protein HNV11_20870 [Spirosoma taeanense]